MEINKLVFLVTLFFISNSFSQDSEILYDDLDPLDPSKAAFFSAVFPGAGQAFNKKYWIFISILIYNNGKCYIKWYTNSI